MKYAYKQVRTVQSKKTFLECSIHVGHRAREEENHDKLRQETGQVQVFHEQWCNTWTKTVREEKEKRDDGVWMSAPLLHMTLY